MRSVSTGGSDIVRLVTSFRTFPAALMAAMMCCAIAPEAAAQIGSELSLRVLRVGPGGGAREGDWAGMLVEYEDTSLSTTGARDVLLRVRGVDVDGDPPVYERVVVAQGGQPRSAWLYAKLPMNISVGSELRLSAHEAVEAPASPRGVRAGRELARVDVPLANVSPNNLGLIGVIGQRDLGLNQYAQDWGAGLTWSPLGHELDSVAVFGAGELPDRWHGLAPFEVLVWGTGQETDPLAVSVPRARAVRQWVERGGHLVVVLPSVGQAWTSAGSNPLSGLLPAMDPPVRREGVDLEPYRALLTQSATGPLPGSATVHELIGAEDAGPLEAAPLLQGPDGGALAMQRVVGSGRVTVVGLDLGQTGLVSRSLPEAEAFWHRVLGRRGPVMSASEARSRVNSRSVIGNAEGRRPHLFDHRIEELIDQRGAAALGVLLGTILFVVYWLVAGPVGYALLRGRLRKHSWVAYAGAAVVFSVLAWSIAVAIRPGEVRGTHVALLEQVHGSGVQRARVWSTVLIPWYGNAELSVGDAPDDTDVLAGREATDLIAAFEPSGLGRGLGGFPDNRTYRIDARAPERMTVPVRQTVKQVRADWQGAAGWSLPRPHREPGSLDDASVRMELDDRDVPRVTGRLSHDLPGPMRDVTVLVVGPQRPVGPPGARLGRSSIVLHGHAISPFGSGGWSPGEVLDLGEALGGAEARSADRLESFLADLASKGENTQALGRRISSSRGNMLERLLLAGLIDQMGVPDVFRTSGTAAAQRISSHGWDLGPWFTRPCLIVMGIVRQDGGEPPAPLRVDGEAFGSRGDTVVRWIYPFEAAPPAFEAADDDEDRDDGDPGGG